MEHQNRKHALLSASGSERWLKCTPSPRLEEKFTDHGSDYAREGTLAHEFADAFLKEWLGIISPNEYLKIVRKLRKHELYTDEMEGQVAKFTNYVIEEFKAAQSVTSGAILLVEQTLDFSHIVPEGFGTGDCVIISDGTLEVNDFKYGKGVPVFADENTQLMLYGIGALRKHELNYDIHTVKLTVTQPRLDSISSWEISVEDLKKWGEEIVKPTALIAFAGEGEQVAGKWCRFCKVKPRCKAIQALALEAAKNEFAEPELLDDVELVEMYEILPAIVEYLQSVKDYMLNEGLAGKKWKGYKVVAGRANRKWLNIDGVIKALRKEGFKRSQYINSKLAGIGEISNLLSKDRFEELLDPFILKPEGKPTLVQDSDKRPSIVGLESALEDFKD